MKANEKCTSIVPAAYHNQCCYASLTNHISHKHVGTKCMSVRPFLYLSTEVARFNPLQREFVTPSACFVPFVKSTRQLWIVFREVCRCWKCLNSERQAIQRNPCSATFAILYQIVHFRVVALLCLSFRSAKNHFQFSNSQLPHPTRANVCWVVNAARCVLEIIQIPMSPKVLALRLLFCLTTFLR